jgi:hypothetical protein
MTRDAALSWNEEYLQHYAAMRWIQGMTENSTPPILGHALDQPSGFTPKNLIDDVWRSRQISRGIVPPVCILEFDGEITDWLIRGGIAKPFGPWACFHISCTETGCDYLRQIACQPC